MDFPLGTPEQDALWAARAMYSLIGRICNEAGIEEGDLVRAEMHERTLGTLVAQATKEQLTEVRDTLVEYNAGAAYEWGHDARTVRQILYTHLITDNTYIDDEDPN